MTRNCHSFPAISHHFPPFSQAHRAAPLAGPSAVAGCATWETGVDGGEGPTAGIFSGFLARDRGHWDSPKINFWQFPLKLHTHRLSKVFCVARLFYGTLKDLGLIGPEKLWLGAAQGVWG